MAWICVKCSEQHEGSLKDMGYGLCKECDAKMKLEKAKKKEMDMKARNKAYGKHS